MVGSFITGVAPGQGAIRSPVPSRQPSNTTWLELPRKGGEPDAQELADRCQHEIDVWHDCSELYGYEFLVPRVR